MTIDPTEQAIRDELPREVLSYAEGLRRQMYEIARRYGVEKPADIGPKIESGEVSLEDMDRMVELKKLLDATVAEKRIPRAGVRRLETEKKRWRQEFLDEIGPIAELLNRPTRTVAPPHSEKPPGWSQELADAVEALPRIPIYRLLSDGHAVQDLIHLIWKVVGEQQRSSVGLVACMAVNRTLREMSEASRALVRQTVHSNGMHGLGFEWPGGTLDVKGVAGTHLGAGMTGGTIRADQIDNFAGARMRGGELILIGSHNNHFVGMEMAGGAITIETAGHGLGWGMVDGRIRVVNAQQFAGREMRGGEIEIAETAGISLGMSMRGGKIRAKVAGSDVGELMEGGIIEVVAAIGSVGINMKGGTILLTEYNREVGHGKTGGVVRFVGPWAWLKNLQYFW